MEGSRVTMTFLLTWSMKTGLNRRFFPLQCRQTECFCFEWRWVSFELRANQTRGILYRLDVALSKRTDHQSYNQSYTSTTTTLEA